MSVLKLAVIEEPEEGMKWTVESEHPGSTNTAK